MAQWPCTIEIAWVDLGHPYPGSYKQEILANRGQKVRSRSTGAIQSCTANDGTCVVGFVHGLSSLEVFGASTTLHACVTFTCYGCVRVKCSK